MRGTLALAVGFAFFPAAAAAGNCAASGTRYKPADTPCSSTWTKEEGSDIDIRFNIAPGVVRHYGSVRSCVYYEVCAPELDKYIDAAHACCEEGGRDRSPRCVTAKRKAGTAGVKACLGYYFIEGQNNPSTKLNPYDLSGPACCAAGTYPEWAWWCQALAKAPDTRWSGRCDSPGGQGNGTPSPLASAVGSMRCSPEPRFRPSGNVVGGNSCTGMLFAPTSIVTEASKNAGCTNDAGVLTTLLRKAGYTGSEVMSVSGYFHYFTIVKIPGTGGFTVAEKADITPAEFGPVCAMDWVDCHNDTGIFRCPPKRQVVGCGAENVPPAVCPDGCAHEGRCLAVGQEECVAGERYRCVGSDLHEYLGKCCTGGCLYGGQCYVTGQKDCIGGRQYQCAGPHAFKTLGRCKTPKQQCGDGCLHDGDCYETGETKCVEGKVWRCDGDDKRHVIGLCCPGGCLYNARCYKTGETECVDGDTWQCVGEDRTKLIRKGCATR